jgi:fumarylacetoacetase
MYWTPAQMVTHHASNLQPGDLLASGTVSGPDAGSAGCLLERTRGGEDPVTLPDGELRRFLDDDDEVLITGFCRRSGFARIGLGECRGTILPAHTAA